MKRDLAIDATRGLAIWSMISLHFANGMLIARPTHSFPTVDGMSAFILLSGLVLGLVYRRWIDRFTLGYAYRRLAKRLVVLYVAQVTISLVAVWACAALTSDEFGLITGLPADLDLAQQLWWTVTLRFLPSGGSILVVYLILMALAFVVLPLLQRGAWAPVLGFALAGYAISQAAVEHPWMTVYSYPGHGPIQNWLAWQALFVPALVVGWKWDDWRIPERLDRALPYLVVATVAVGLLLRQGKKAGWLYSDQSLTDKVDLGPIRLAAAWLVIPTVYVVFRRLLQWWRRDWLQPLVLVGARSLDSYVIQAVALIAIPTLLVMRPWNEPLSTVITLAVFGVCWAWSWFRRRWQIDRLHRLPVIISERAKART